jgi:hypothetical protein
MKASTLNKATFIGAVSDNTGTFFRLFEHPTMGDEAPMITKFDGDWFITHCWDTEDMQDANAAEEVEAGIWEKIEVK